MCGGPPAPSDKPIANKSGRVVKCVKFQKDLPGLDAPPWPGELGQRVYENVSVQAWKLWEDRQKMILNEYRLMPWQKEGQELIRKQMEDSSSEKDPPCRPTTCRSNQSNYAADTGISGSMVKCSLACASRSAPSAWCALAARAKMNPR
jgi:Fe-S cluster biosynthesis and repair protein YggX